MLAVTEVPVGHPRTMSYAWRGTSVRKVSSLPLRSLPPSRGTRCGTCAAWRPALSGSAEGTGAARLPENQAIRTTRWPAPAIRTADPGAGVRGTSVSRILDRRRGSARHRTADRSMRTGASPRTGAFGRIATILGRIASRKPASLSGDGDMAPFLHMCRARANLAETVHRDLTKAQWHRRAHAVAELRLGSHSDGSLGRPDGGTGPPPKPALADQLRNWLSVDIRQAHFPSPIQLRSGGPRPGQAGRIRACPGAAPPRPCPRGGLPALPQPRGTRSRSARKTSSGVRPPGTFRGRRFRRSRASRTRAGSTRRRSVPCGKYCRGSPLACSFSPRSQEWQGRAKQKPAPSRCATSRCPANSLPRTPCRCRP